MDSHIRPYVEGDLEAIVDLSLRAWEPVFDSFRKVLGPQIFALIYPDWRKSQQEGVEKTCRTGENVQVLVGECDGRAVGFIAFELKGDTGEVHLLAVHPDHQNQGIGTALNVAAMEEMKRAGVKLVEVGTGGDEGHAPARRSYEKAGYTALPLVRYYIDLQSSGEHDGQVVRPA
jgi:ribosomal protein S18 acetylase RimI-like enzyme